MLHRNVLLIYTESTEIGLRKWKNSPPYLCKSQPNLESCSNWYKWTVNRVALIWSKDSAITSHQWSSTPLERVPSVSHTFHWSNFSFNNTFILGDEMRLTCVEQTTTSYLLHLFSQSYGSSVLLHCNTPSVRVSRFESTRSEEIERKVDTWAPVGLLCRTMHNSNSFHDSQPEIKRNVKKEEEGDRVSKIEEKAIISAVYDV